MATSKASLGIFVDGNEIRVARLSIRKGTVVIEELEAQHLSTKLEEAAVETSAEGGGAETTDFGMSQQQPVPAETVLIEAETGNNSVLLGLLSKYTPGRYSFSYAISEPSLYYHVFENDFGLSGKKLLKRVIEELQAVRGIKPSVDAVSMFYTADKNLVAVVREDGLALLNVLESIKQYIGHRLPKIPLLESADVALMNLARTNFGFMPEEYTSIIYIGIEFSRIIFMKGTDFLHFAPVLAEGFDSSNIRNTVYSRLLLEQDNVGIPRLNKILLAGESHKIGFDEFLREQLPEVEIQSLTTPYLDSSALPADVQEQIPEYAIAIATAHKALDETHPGFYPVNLIPESVRESQRAFKLAWHGYVLLIMIFFSTFFFTSRFTTQRALLLKQNSTVQQLRAREEENRRLQWAINGLNGQINKYQLALAVYDSMAPGSDRWSKIVERLAKGTEDLNSVWIDQVQSSPSGGMELTGYATERSRIPRIAALFDDATLTKVEVKPIREKTPPVYSFELSIPPPPVDTTHAAPKVEGVK